MEMEPRQNRRTKTEVKSVQSLPDDLVLEIVSRCPAIAVVIRCAATSKPIRRGILNAGFRRQLRGVHHPCIPSLLLGLYHEAEDPRLPPVFVPTIAKSNIANYPRTVTALPPPRPAPNHAANEVPCDFSAYWPVAFGRSLLVLRRQCKLGVKRQDHLAERHGKHPVELSVCNPATGERWVLPPHDVADVCRVLLDVDPLAPSSFKLLIADLTSETEFFVQIFSSDDDSSGTGGAWGPAVALAFPVGPALWCAFGPSDNRLKSAVVDGTVHWLCTACLPNCYFPYCILAWRWRDYYDAPPPPKTSLLKLPKRSQHSFRDSDICLAALPSADATTSQPMLGVIFLDRDTNSVVIWVRAKPDDKRWSRRHVIDKEEIARPMGFECSWLQRREYPWFCEGSGNVFLRDVEEDDDPSLLLLSLDYEAVLTQKKSSAAVRKLQVQAKGWDTMEPKFCPYEVDLLSYMLLIMKPF